MRRANRAAVVAQLLSEQRAVAAVGGQAHERRAGVALRARGPVAEVAVERRGLDGHEDDVEHQPLGRRALVQPERAHVAPHLGVAGLKAGLGAAALPGAPQLLVAAVLHVPERLLALAGLAAQDAVDDARVRDRERERGVALRARGDFVHGRIGDERAWHEAHEHEVAHGRVRVRHDGRQVARVVAHAGARERVGALLVAEVVGLGEVVLQVLVELHARVEPQLRKELLGGLLHDALVAERHRRRPGAVAVAVVVSGVRLQHAQRRQREALGGDVGQLGHRRADGAAQLGEGAGAGHVDQAHRGRGGAVHDLHRHAGLVRGTGGATGGMAAGPTPRLTDAAAPEPDGSVVRAAAAAARRCRPGWRGPR